MYRKTPTYKKQSRELTGAVFPKTKAHLEFLFSHYTDMVSEPGSEFLSVLTFFSSLEGVFVTLGSLCAIPGLVFTLYSF